MQCYNIICIKQNLTVKCFLYLPLFWVNPGGLRAKQRRPSNPILSIMLAALLISGLPALAVNNPLFNAHAAKICSKCYYILKYIHVHIVKPALVTTSINQ
jgi:hypothetical protein